MKTIGLFFLICVLSTTAIAQNPEDADQGVANNSSTVPQRGGLPDITGLLFIGTSQNSAALGDTLNDVFTVDPNSNTSTSVIASEQVWGATADPDNERVLYTRSDGVCFGCQLVSVPYAGGAETVLGNINSGGLDFRIDGLAISGGTLYGMNADSTNNGLYSIDMNTFEATLEVATLDSISGIDADPDTGTIYGVNDTTGQLVSIDPVAQTFTDVAAYPVGFTDIDGLAVGEGNAYLITDESQDINIYDLGADSYVGTLTSPFAAADVFTGGAYAVTTIAAPAIPVPGLSLISLGLLSLLMLVLCHIAFSKHRKRV